MLRHVVAVFPLLLGAALVIAGSGFASTGAALDMTSLGFGGMAAGGVVAAYYGGLVFGTTHVPKLLEGVGHVRVFAALTASACASTALLPVLSSSGAWLVLRGVTGFSMAGLYMTVESWLSERSSDEDRGTIFSLYMIVNQLALAASQFLVPVMPLGDSHYYLITTALVAVAAVPVTLARSPQPANVAPERWPLGRVLRRSPLGVFTAFGSGVFVGVFFGMAPLYADALGLRETGPHFVAVVVLAGLFSQLPVGRLSDRLGRRPLIVAVSVVLAAVCGVYSIAPPENATSLLILGALTGALGFVLYPLGLALTIDLIGKTHAVSASGTILLSYGVGAFVAPLAAGWLLASSGPAWAPALVALPPAAVIVVSVWRMFVTGRVRTRGRYLPVTMPQTQPASELDPRTEI